MSDRSRVSAWSFVLTLLALLSPSPAAGQGAPSGEWRYWGGDAAMTRYSPLDQIDAENFENLEVAWLWRGDNFGPEPDFILRSTPIYADGKLYTVAGRRRTVAAIDPATGVSTTVTDVPLLTVEMSQSG